MSRSQQSNPFGKLDSEIKLPIDESTKEALSALAFARSKPLAEYIRDVLQLHVHGHAAVLRSRMRVQESGSE